VKKIIVTGGLGYIGSHTVVELMSAGYEPVIVDDLSNSSIKILKQLQKITGKTPAFHQLDLSSPDQVAKLLLLEKSISGIIHFAAFKAVGESVGRPLKYYKNNFYSLINLLDQLGAEVPFVFSSSCTVYGEPDSLPVSESAIVKQAESPYGNTKQVAEEILKDLVAAEPERKVIALRYFNPVGAHHTALIGELPIGVPQNLVPFITQTAIGKREQLTVFGNDYHTKDGSCIRDYIHVVDLAKAHVAAIQYMELPDFNGYDVFNIGTGKGYTVLEVINTFEEVNNLILNYQIGPRRNGDIERIWGNVDKSSKLMAWEAELQLETMLSSSWQWEKYMKDNF